METAKHLTRAKLLPQTGKLELSPLSGHTILLVYIRPLICCLYRIARGSKYLWCPMETVKHKFLPQTGKLELSPLSSSECVHTRLSKEGWLGLCSEFLKNVNKYYLQDMILWPNS